MGYIHNLNAVMMADQITKRAKEIAEEKKLMRLSKLQQELFDLMKAELVDGDLAEYMPGFSKDNMDAFLEDLRKDISTMDAVDLRRNIRLWKEDISFGRRK